jgi:alkanesulfonate monooxygenase SsuD/methylene tetrahydromethanopterin reductase-like flavin-dependent oxidoreductase (luciferase family)
MKVGICLPYMKRDYDRDAILGFCRKVDEGPFSSLSCGERIVGYTYEMRMLMSAAAAVTQRVRIVPSLYVLPMHDAVWAAKEVATLDVLSGGRVTLAVGVGGRESDYRAVGADFTRRTQRMDEQIATMRRIWAGETKLREYVYAYLEIAGEKIAHRVAKSMTRCTPDAVRASMEAYTELGVDEIMLVPATAELAEIDRSAEIIAGL